MLTSAFVNYMSERLDGSLTREHILNMINRAQNEILSHDNRITRIVPDPFLHTGSDELSLSGLHNAGDDEVTVTTLIPETTPKKGYLLITEGGVTKSYEYIDYTPYTFQLQADVYLLENYNSGSEVASCIVDDFNLIASGAVFSSQPNKRTEQYDVRKITRVYAFKSKVGNYRGYGRNNTSYKPDRSFNLNSNEIEVECDTSESLEPNTGDCKVQFWRENSPGNTTETYMVEAYRWPRQVLTESIPLTIPDQWQTTLLRFAILRDVEYTEYGKSDQPEVLYQKYLAEFLASTKSNVDSTTPTITIPKDF